MTIQENVNARLANNKAISTSAFLPDGENTASQRAEAVNRMNGYVKSLAIMSEHLKTYALAYFGATYNKNGAVNNPTKSIVDVLVGDVIDTARALYITDMTKDTALYIAKCMCNIAHNFKAIDKDNKAFTADFSAKGIKRPFERALYDGMYGNYAQSIIDRDNYVKTREINKLVKKCIDLAEHGKSKALNNHLDKLSRMTDKEKFEEVKADIMLHYVEIIPADSEKPIDVPKGTISTDITPNTEKTEKTA